MAAVSKVMIRFLMVCLIFSFCKVSEKEGLLVRKMLKRCGFLWSGWILAVLGENCEIFGILREINCEIFGRNVYLCVRKDDYEIQQIRLRQVRCRLG